jgi:hypothetical protein
MTDEDGIACCNQCKQPLIEIDHYGERLVGCIECNRWRWPGIESVSMALPEEGSRGAEGDGAQVGLITVR